MLQRAASEEQDACRRLCGAPFAPEQAEPLYEADFFSWTQQQAALLLRAARILRENPGLKPKRGELFASAYSDTRKEAATETGLPLPTFPAEPPFSLEALADEAFFPVA